MYAIVEIAGKQFRVEPNLIVRIPRMEQEVGAKVSFDKVLMHADSDVRIGTPYVATATVTASIVGHGRDEKVMVFKKKKRKGYRVLRGHRQGYTEVKVDTIKA